METFRSSGAIRHLFGFRCWHMLKYGCSMEESQIVCPVVSKGLFERHGEYVTNQL